MGPRQTHPPVYGIGYTGRTLDELRHIIEQLDAVLVDIRFAPYSRNPQFRKDALEQALGDRYVYLRAFGNRNYKGGPVALVDYDVGRAALAALDKPALLMCMCKDPATCHRTAVMQRLAEEGYDVQEWNEGGGQQLTLW